MSAYGWFVNRIPKVATPAARAGIIAASANFATSFARGLLPRSPGQQAIATGILSAAMYEVATTAHAGAETFSLFTTGTHGMRGRTPDPGRTMVADMIMATVGAAITQVLPTHPDEEIAKSIARFTGETMMVSGISGATVQAIDEGLKLLFPGRAIENRPLLVDVGVGGLIAGVNVYYRHRMAIRYGLVDPKRRAVKRAGLVSFVKASGIGVGSAAGMLALAATEQSMAHLVTQVLESRLKKYDIASPIVGHAVTLAIFTGAGTLAFSTVKKRVEKHGDIVEPAYLAPPTSDYVTAGPRSIIKFSQIGMEGRRFVLMALTPERISNVMNSPAIEPVRVVAGYETGKRTEDRAKVCLREMEAVGAFDRSIICIAAPTGVGYVSYTFAEALEYLTLGDCAIVVPQYALVPSALALFETHDGVNLQKLVIKMARERIQRMPEGTRPRLVQFGESLGAQVALDIAYPGGAPEFDAMGLDAGLYFGVPFRSTTWNAWRHGAREFDPNRSMVLISEPSEYFHLSQQRREQARHLMVVHDDDPVNKFTYRLIVRQPWWMGPPKTRPPKVPRETTWHPVTTFVLTTVDLMNGMDFKPGVFVRRGHDYRIDSREAVIEAFDLPCTPPQAEAIEAALREREQAWATRRMVARKFAKARDSVVSTLKAWGVTTQADSLGDFSMAVADVDPNSNGAPRH